MQKKRVSSRNEIRRERNVAQTRARCKCATGAERCETEREENPEVETESAGMTNVATGAVTEVETPVFPWVPAPGVRAWRAVDHQCLQKCRNVPPSREAWTRTVESVPRAGDGGRAAVYKKKREVGTEPKCATPETEELRTPVHAGVLAPTVLKRRLTVGAGLDRL